MVYGDLLRLSTSCTTRGWGGQESDGKPGSELVELAATGAAAQQKGEKTAPTKDSPTPNHPIKKAHIDDAPQGKVRDKLNNAVLFDQPTYDKLLKEVGNASLC